ncbi:unnamed protein product [Arctogadus glacialis]
MASPSKLPRSDGETVVSHLHCVSPIKMSRNSRRYFEATLQTGREDFNRVVCFSPEKRDQFVQAADNRQAVKLVATRKSIRLRNRDSPAAGRGTSGSHNPRARQITGKLTYHKLIRLFDLFLSRLEALLQGNELVSKFQ